MDEVNSRTFEVNVAKAVDILGIQKYFEWRKDYKAYHVFVYACKECEDRYTDA